ncbi:hypothetical protein LINGRAPRIM_LOCUS2823 [Linum grandiflorum]
MGQGNYQRGFGGQGYNQNNQCYSQGNQANRQVYQRGYQGQSSSQGYPSNNQGGQGFTPSGQGNMQVPRASPPGFSQMGSSQVVTQGRAHPTLDTNALILQLLQDQEASRKDQQQSQAVLDELAKQMGSMGKMVYSRQPGTLLGNTEENPKGGDVKGVHSMDAIVGRRMPAPLSMVIQPMKETPPMPTPFEEVVLEDETKLETEDEQEEAKEKPKMEVRYESVPPWLEDKSKKASRKPKDQTTCKISDVPPPHVAYPERFQADLKKESFEKFCERLQDLHFTLPFIEAITKLPEYSKFMKEIFTNKKRLMEAANIGPREECLSLSSTLDLLRKLKDPGSFLLSCKINDRVIEGGLADLGASVNVMSHSLYDKLGLGPLSPSKTRIQLADRSLTSPRGVVKNVGIHVGEFAFLVDFVVLDTE